ncbi:MAG: hypothetical protein WC584_03740 [Candidatus Pacearchaeota archaeon]
MGYYEEKKKYEEIKENTTNQNKCPECKKGIMVVTIQLKNAFTKSQIFKSFCPVCGYTIKKVI